MTVVGSIQSNDPTRAAFYVVLAMALIGLVDNLVIQIAAEAGLWQFHATRAAMALPLIALIGVVMGWQVWPRNVLAVGVRGILLAISMLFYFGALAFLSVAEAVAGLFTAPIFVLVISMVWYRQPVSAANIAAVIIGFSGSLLLLRPDVGEVVWVNVFPIAGGLFYAFAVLSTRRMCVGEGALSLLAGFFVALLCFAALGLAVTSMSPEVAPKGPDGFLVRGWVAPSYTFVSLTMVQAISSVVGVGLITRGYILAEASQVSVFEYVLLIFAAFWGWILWGDMLDALGYLGVAMIIASGALLMHADGKVGRT